MSTALAPTRQGIPLRPDRDAVDREQRCSLMRAVTGVAFSSPDRSAEACLVANWPSDNLAGLVAKTLHVTERVTKAAVTPMTIAPSGLPEAVFMNVLPTLAPMSAAVRLFARCMKVAMSFGIGADGNVVDLAFGHGDVDSTVPRGQRLSSTMSMLP